MSSVKVAFETFGCRSNFADSVDIQSALQQEGVLGADSSEADVLVVNTCTVTDSADKTVFRAIRRAKEQNPEARIVVTGCLAEVGEERLMSTGLVDSVVGPGRRQEVVDAVLGKDRQEIEQEIPSVYPGGKRAKKSAPKFRSLSLDEQMSASVPGPGGFARARFHLRVQEGCENSCTFCIIPSTRGRYKSREPELILADLRQLEELGYKEVVLSGTHLGAYGVDLGLNLLLLLREMEAHTGLRIRLSSIDPEEVSFELVDHIAESQVFCPHLHICVQAFNERVLKLMNRKHTLAEAEEIIHYAAQRIPGICIGSDVICGFPSETREESDKAMEHFLSLPINYLHVFPYSERAETAALRLQDVVPIAERKRRAARFRAIALRKKEDWLRSLIGSELDLVLETDTERGVTATTAEYAPAVVALENADWSAGQRVKARATEYLPNEERVKCVL